MEEKALSHFQDMSSKTRRGLVPLFVLFTIICLAACGKTQTAKKSEVKTEASADASSEEPQKTIDPVSVILSGATDEFFAGCDENQRESFLDWFKGVYGEEVLESIAENGVLDDPEVWKDSTGRTIKTLFWDYHQNKDDSFYKENQIEEIEPQSTQKTTFLFSGDLTLAENTATTVLMDKNPNSLSQCFDQGLMDVMRGADFFTINNEFCYGSKTTGKRLLGKDFCFRANPSRVKLLDRIGADLVSLANNHVYDYGEDAFYSTLSTLKKNGTPYIGAGKNLKEAEKAHYVISNGRTTSIIAGTQIERSTNFTRAAGEDSPGVLKCLDPTEYVKAIKAAKQNADDVIVICHWGTEGTHYYGGDQTALAEKFIKAGASAVLGGHTHTLQAVEYMNGVPVFYSLGNFYFSSTMNMPRDYDTALAEIVISRDGDISEKLIPCHFSNGKTSKLKKGSSGYNRIIADMNSWSSSAVIQKNGVIKRK